MDPPLKIQIDTGNFKSKLNMALKVLALNGLIIMGLIAIVYTASDKIGVEKIISEYKRSYIKIYFQSFSKQNLFYITWTWSLLAAISEEVIYRGPICWLIKNNLKIKTADRDITMPCLIIMSFALNIIWSIGHTIVLPVFISGIPLYWLVFKTKSIWPSALCHFLANISLYFLIQLAIYFTLIQPIK